MIRWQQPDIRNTDGTNSWENVTAAVVQNANALALLQQIIEKPAFDFEIKYEPGVADIVFANFYLAQSKRAHNGWKLPFFVIYIKATQLRQ